MSGNIAVFSSILDSPVSQVPFSMHYHGAVAQLEERHVRNVEVAGSIPVGSTI
jgi:hypothetical protein